MPVASLGKRRCRLHLETLGQRRNYLLGEARRRHRQGTLPDRALRNTIITTFGDDLATANTEFCRVDTDCIGRQSQTWVRLPEPHGWRIVAAHVSFMT